MHSLVLVTPPSQEPLTLAEVKLHCRVDGTAEDALLTGLISAARQHVEDYCRRALLTQTWRVTVDCWPQSGTLFLPRPKLQSVSSVKYIGSAGVEQLLDPSQYVVDADSLPGRVRRAYNTVWPQLRYEPGAVRIQYVSGYGDDATKLPAPILAAMKLLIGSWYANREHVVTGTIATELPGTVAALLGPYRYREG